MKSTVYNTQGKETSTFEAPESVFAQKWNADLLHEVVTSMMSNARQGTADTKGRGEVRGGGKKPWKQKGTGRARHGSSRSPIWRGGGVTHGPLAEKNYAKKINRTVRAKALGVALSRKFKDGEVVFLESFSFEAPKAKDAKGILLALSGVKGVETLATKRKNSALIVLPARHIATEKSFQNFGNVSIAHARDLNPVDVMTYKYVIIAEPEASVGMLVERMTAKKAARSTVAPAPNAVRAPKASSKKAVKK